MGQNGRVAPKRGVRRQRPSSSAGGQTLGKQAQENRASTTLAKFRSFLPPPLLSSPPLSSPLPLKPVFVSLVKILS